MIEKIKILLAFVLYSILLTYYQCSSQRKLVDEDVDRWTHELRIRYRNKMTRLVCLLKFHPQFRNLFYFRVRNILNIFRIVCPPDKSITLADDGNRIQGGGIYFEHAFGTRIAAKSIGKGCTFRQLSCVGVKSKDKHSEKPTIGDNVDFGVNVLCIGDITIGDNAVIGAGAVVVKDIPPNAVAVGNPAKIIGYRS